MVENDGAAELVSAGWLKLADEDGMTCGADEEEAAPRLMEEEGATLRLTEEDGAALEEARAEEDEEMTALDELRTEETTDELDGRTDEVDEAMLEEEEDETTLDSS